MWSRSYFIGSQVGGYELSFWQVTAMIVGLKKNPNMYFSLGNETDTFPPHKLRGRGTSKTNYRVVFVCFVRD